MGYTCRLSFSLICGPHAGVGTHSQVGRTIFRPWLCFSGCHGYQDTWIFIGWRAADLSPACPGTTVHAAPPNELVR